MTTKAIDGIISEISYVQMKPLSRAIIFSFFAAVAASSLPTLAQEYDAYQVVASPVKSGEPSTYSIYGIDTQSGESELVEEFTTTDSRGILGGESSYNPATNSIEIYGAQLDPSDGTGAVRYDYNIDTGEVSQYTLTSLDGVANLGSSTTPIYIDKPLISETTSGEIRIGENGLITVDENGVQKLYAKDANGNAIPIDITEGSDLLVNGISVMGSIEENTENIETNRTNISANAANIEANRKNINDLGYGVAGATALTAALSSLPVASYDAPISCGIGTGGYSSRFAMGLGCAARLNERLFLNVGGSHVFGGSSDYGGASLGTIAARGGFVFKLGTIHKPSNHVGEELQSQLVDVKQENKELLARLERLEAIALGRHSEVTAVSIK